LKAWSNAVCDNVMACSSEGDAAYAWILCVKDENATFTDMGQCERRFIQLDAKLRTALTKFTVGESANRHRELVDEINKAAEIAEKAKVPLRGRQIFFMVRQFYQIDADRQIQFDLNDLTKIEYPGDALMHKFLTNWDNMLSNMKVDRKLIPDEYLATQLVEAIRKSEKLRTYIEHYDRQQKSHPDHTYAFLHDNIRKVVIEERQRKNKEQLMVEHASARKKPTATPAVHNATSSADAPAKPGRRERRKPEGGDNGSDSGKSDASTTVRLSSIEYKDRCCIRHLWKKCTEDVENGGCKFGPHLKKAPEIITQHSLYARMLTEHGPPDKFKPDGKGKGKGKDGGKGKRKGKEAAPAIIGDAAADPQPAP
jgi:hypothetical protein